MSERVPAAVGGALLFAVDALYLALIAAEGEQELASTRVLFVAGSLAGAAAAALAGAAIRGNERRGVLLALATATVLGWAWLALFSIGLLLVLAAIPMAIAAAGSLRALDAAAAGSIAAAAVVVAALDVTVALLFTD